MICCNYQWKQNNSVNRTELQYFVFSKYLQINTWAFPYWLGYHSETPILARYAVEGQYGSRDDNKANMEMPMIVLNYLSHILLQYVHKSQCWLFAHWANTGQISVFALIYSYLPPYSTAGVCAVVAKIICQSARKDDA